MRVVPISTTAGPAWPKGFYPGIFIDDFGKPISDNELYKRCFNSFEQEEHKVRVSGLYFPMRPLVHVQQFTQRMISYGSSHFINIPAGMEDVKPGGESIWTFDTVRSASAIPMDLYFSFLYGPRQAELGSQVLIHSVRRIPGRLAETAYHVVRAPREISKSRHEIVQWVQGLALSGRYSLPKEAKVKDFTSSGDYVTHTLAKEKVLKQISLAHAECNKDLGSRIMRTTNAIEYGIEGVAMIRSLLSGRFWGELPKLTNNLAKDVANLYLRYSYGERLFIQDTQLIIETLKKTSSKATQKSSATATVHLDGVKFRKKVYFDPYSGAMSALRAFDFTLNPKNFWDLIPYSFVVDWFLPVEDLLDPMAGMMDEFLIEGHSITGTYQTHSVSSEGAPVKTTVFYRGVGKGGNMSTSLSLSTPNWRQQLSGVSLIVQRL